MATKKKAAGKPRARAKARKTTTARRKPAARAAASGGLRLRSAGPSFTVNDLQKSLAFYRDALGFREGERWERDGTLMGVELKAGSVRVWIGQDDWKKGRDRLKGGGFRVYFETSQDVDQLAAGIKARGGTLAEEPHTTPWGSRSFAVTDPDGFKMTITNEA